MSLLADLSWSRTDTLSQQELNRRAKIIADAIEALRAFAPSWDAEVAALRDVGLDRINDALLPAYEQIRDLAHLGALLSAASDTEVEIGLGIKTFVIGEGVRANFAPTPFLMAVSGGDFDKSMAGVLSSYDTETGVLVMTATSSEGEGTHGDWRIGPIASTDDLEALRDQVVSSALAAGESAGGAEAARDVAVGARDDAQDARDAAQAWADEAEDTPVLTGPDLFSARHWAAKAQAAASAIAQSDAAGISFDPSGSDLTAETVQAAIEQLEENIAETVQEVLEQLAENYRLHNHRTITSSGTYTPNADVKAIVVEVQGAGGSGGGSAVLSGGDRGAASGGGGEGGYAIRVILNPQPATVTIGAGGVGVNGGTNTGNGTSGGNTVYSAGAITITGHGGERAPGTDTGGNNATSRAGGDGGNASGGNINIRGQTGGHGFAIGLNALNGNRVIAVGGHGARSRFGRGGAGGCDDGISAGGSNGFFGGYGAGGGGATRIIGGTNGNTGGNGGDGIIRIWEYV